MYFSGATGHTDSWSGLIKATITWEDWDKKIVSKTDGLTWLRNLVMAKYTFIRYKTSVVSWWRNSSTKHSLIVSKVNYVK